MAKTRPKSNGNGGTQAPEPVPLVVIVDDDASVRQSTYRLVRSFGYRARSFGSGEEFLGSDAAREMACLLLDVRMPGMDGLEVQRRLAERGAEIPIVFVTGRASEEEERRARSAGARDFLRKPVAQVRLREALEDIIRVPARGNRNGNGGE